MTLSYNNKKFDFIIELITNNFVLCLIMVKQMNKIYDYVYYLSEHFSHRLTATDKEKRAGDWIYKKLKGFKLHPSIEEFSTPSSAYSIFQFVFLMFFLISLFYFQFHISIKLVLLFLQLFLIVLFYQEFNFLHTFVYKLIKPKKSQNVVVNIKPASVQEKTIYICAHYDSATAGLLFHPYIVRLLHKMIKGTFISFYILFINSVLYLIWPQYVFLVVFIVLGFFYLISFCISFHTEYIAKPSKGANDNASSVGVGLHLMEYFKKNRLSNTKVVGLFTGAEEAGCVGIYEYLKKHRFDLDKNSYFIVLDCSGIGNPVYLRSEGMLKKYVADPYLFRLADKVSKQFDFSVDAVDLPMGYTEYNVVANFGFKGISIGAAPAEKKAVPNWHQMNDRIVYIHPETLNRVFQFVCNLVGEINKKAE